MYIPKHFEVTDKDEVFAFVEANAFGQLISNVDGKLFSTHLPFLLSEDKSKIIGHLALKNPQHSEIDGQEVLITLEGPHDYISPVWYSSPGVPTWNYQAVHIYGQCEVIRSTEELQQVVNALTVKYESAFENPWQPEYKPLMLRAIVGIEVTISEIQCQYKLSQNRSSQDRSQVIERLKSLGSTALANEMERNEL
ncbi:transcriptional regulator [Candidatus Endobugula sertula]|uniref:Transcriptional regulator n=1 Tax=Candidatus Endobugula sertula TaxID=62101 RepID=A0A1D2QMC7_9GAMM|nr:transcriptional regulator [Candidatus Endobugula sertula]